MIFREKKIFQMKIRKTCLKYNRLIFFRIELVFISSLFLIFKDLKACACNQLQIQRRAARVVVVYSLPWGAGVIFYWYLSFTIYEVSYSINTGEEGRGETRCFQWKNKTMRISNTDTSFVSFHRHVAFKSQPFIYKQRTYFNTTPVSRNCSNSIAANISD